MLMKRFLSLFSLLMLAIVGMNAQVEVTYALSVGDTFTSGQQVDVKDGSNVVATITYGATGGDAFKAAKENANVSGFGAFTEGNGVNGDKANGTFYTIKPNIDCEINVAVVLNADKKFYIEEDGVALSDYNELTVSEKYYGTFAFFAKAGKSYKIYCAGSKLGFYGFTLTEVVAEPTPRELLIAEKAKAEALITEATTVGLTEMNTLLEAVQQAIDKEDATDNQLKSVTFVLQQAEKEFSILNGLQSGDMSLAEKKLDLATESIKAYNLMTPSRPNEKDAMYNAVLKTVSTGAKATTIEAVAMIKELLIAAELSYILANSPSITLTAELDDSYEREIAVGVVAEGDMVLIDWGNGTPEVKAAGKDSWGDLAPVSFTGKPAGEGIIKIYALSDITTLTAASVVGGAAITSVDVSNAPELKELELNANKLTTIDLSNNTALEKLNISNNQFATIDLAANTALVRLTATSNQLTSIDLSANTELNYVHLGTNQLETIDLSANLKLKNIYLLDNQLTSVSLGENTTDKIYVSLNNNKLETLDVTALTGLANGSLFAMNNNLIEVKHGAVKSMNITGNKFDLATLYEAIQNVTTPTYASQQDYEIPEIIEGSIDLSSQAVIDGKTSEIKWFTESGTELVEGTDYEIEDGTYKFIKEQGEKVYATLQNAEALPKLSTPIKTTLAQVSISVGINEIAAQKSEAVVYNMRGQRVVAPAKGIFIMNGKKVAVK